MSREHVEAVKAAYQYFDDTGEPPWELFDANAEFDASSIVGFGVIRGREQVLASLREYTASFEEWKVEPEEFIDAGEHVVTVVRDGGRVKGTGDEIHNRFAHVWTFRSGRVVRWQTFTDRISALEAAGLNEPGGQ